MWDEIHDDLTLKKNDTCLCLDLGNICTPLKQFTLPLLATNLIKLGLSKFCTACAFSSTESEYDAKYIKTLVVLMMVKKVKVDVSQSKKDEPSRAG